MTRECVVIPFEQHPDYKFPVNKWCLFPSSSEPGLAYSAKRAGSKMYGKTSVLNASPTTLVEGYYYKCECEPDCPNLNPVSGTNRRLMDPVEAIHLSFYSECQVILDPPPDPQPDPDP